MRSKILALVVLLLVAASPAPAKAGGWELGAFFGHAWLDDYGILHPDDDNFYGARIGYFLTHKWSLELSGQLMSTDTEIDPVLAIPDTDMDFKSYRLNALYNFSRGSFQPFLTAGLGIEKFDIDAFDEDTGKSSDIGWNVGAGFRAMFSKHVGLRVDGRYLGIKVGDEIDESQNNMEASAGLSFMFGGGDGGEEVHAEMPANQPPTVTCMADRAEILPGESVNVTATATDPEGDPLTYEWTASTGSVTGTGASAALSFAGATPPANATVTVRVTDNHGNTATSDCSVRLLEPVRKAEAISCIAGGFPRNLSRITNVDKACLDDVAQRLNADPRARVIVIGHSDSHEKGADIAQRRADAVRDYLVKDRSIEGSRVTTRSASSSKPLQTGSDAESQAGNRRVEVWFVPEGATAPE